jgi:hypothetical protein
MYAVPPTAAATTMPPGVTHDDLSLRKAQERRAARPGGQVAVSLVALSVLCGLVAFILCLAAEGSRSEARVHHAHRRLKPRQLALQVHPSLHSTCRCLTHIPRNLALGPCRCRTTS